MKNLLPTLKILAAIISLIIFNDSVYSQNVISSVNVSKNVATISKSLTNDNSGSVLLSKNYENWMSNKNYLDASSSSFNFFVMKTINEEVYEEEKEIEDWMLDESVWFISEPDSDNILYKNHEIEDWMLDDDFWQIIPSRLEDEKKSDKSSIEDWMLDDQFWLMLN